MRWLVGLLSSKVLLKRTKNKLIALSQFLIKLSNKFILGKYYIHTSYISYDYNYSDYSVALME